MKLSELIERLHEVSEEQPRNLSVITKGDFGRHADIDEVEIIEIDKKSYVLLI